MAPRRRGRGNDWQQCIAATKMRQEGSNRVAPSLARHSIFANHLDEVRSRCEMTDKRRRDRDLYG